MPCLQNQECKTSLLNLYPKTHSNTDNPIDVSQRVISPNSDTISKTSCRPVGRVQPIVRDIPTPVSNYNDDSDSGIVGF